VTGYLASVYGLRPTPFYLGIVYAVLGSLFFFGNLSVTIA
jgi:hypothetical protein